ncbi:MAG: retroviral-like aspartic protease family protein [Pseudomonadales bacterium]|nr:retroviral-like aspartic protease family protein [Pseudomonadales bacterium]
MPTANTRLNFFVGLLITLIAQLAIYTPSIASPDDINIQVRGLFNRSAILTINGKQRMMRQGSVSPEGVTLVSADSRSAVVAVNGRTQTLRLSGKIGAQFAKASRREVLIPLNAYGQYLTDGFINGQSAELLVDTGASVVAMSERQANLLGIEYITKGIPGYVETASEKVASYQVTLDQIDIGGLKAYNVQAVVLKGDLPSKILLGMSYLRNVELRERQGMLNLLEKR